MCANRLPALVLVATLLLAGCSGLPGGPATTGGNGSAPTPDGTPEATTSESTPTATTGDRSTPTPTGGATVTVEGGTLSVDAGATFARVLRLTGRDVEVRSVRLRNLTERKRYRPGAIPFFQVLGIENASFDHSVPGGLTRLSGVVYLHPGDGSPAAVERVLAHEYVHVVQFETEMLPWRNALNPPRSSLDLALALSSVVEGGAVFVTDAYVDRHLPGAARQSTVVAEHYRAGPTGRRFFWAKYHFGVRYVRSRVSSPADLSAAYRPYPRSTEQVLHNETPETEPRLALATGATDDSEQWLPVGNDTGGELLLRVALRGTLNRSVAVRAATGWGNDEIEVFRHAEDRRRQGFVWGLRWDSPADADEFERTVRAFAARREASADAAFEVRRVGDDTVAVLAGDPAFVGNATVSGSNGAVNATVGG